MIVQRQLAHHLGPRVKINPHVELDEVAANGLFAAIAEKFFESEIKIDKLPERTVVQVIAGDLAV
ncbi:MAG TPA: hypothetical protein VMU69_22340 [Bradyrhizobium sp.]|nr:hypothetical protein [Bradyrhizobium sp.]